MGWKTLAETEAHFWSRVDKTTTPDGCWTWTGPCDPYGRGNWGLGETLAHRQAYAFVHGMLPEERGRRRLRKLKVFHTCKNPPCVRPSHLWLGRKRLRDFRRRVRVPGEANPRHKLTWAIVDVIRARLAAGDSQRALALEFRVSQPLIHYIKAGKTWREEDRP